MRLVCFVVASFVVASAQGASENCVTDMVFLVDQSSSITLTNYKNTILPFLDNLVEGLSIDPDGDRVAFVPFSDSDLTEVAFYFNKYSDAEGVIAAIANDEFRGGNTATTKALELARDSVFDAANGARKSNYNVNVAPTLLIITDGVATDADPVAVAADLRSRGVAVFAIKVGSLVNEEYLAKITGDSKRVFAASSYQELTQELAQAIIASTSSCQQRNGIFRQA